MQMSASQIFFANTIFLKSRVNMFAKINYILCVALFAQNNTSYMFHI